MVPNAGSGVILLIILPVKVIDLIRDRITLYIPVSGVSKSEKREKPHAGPGVIIRISSLQEA